MSSSRDPKITLIRGLRLINEQMSLGEFIHTYESRATTQREAQALIIGVQPPLSMYDRRIKDVANIVRAEQKRLKTKRQLRKFLKQPRELLEDEVSVQMADELYDAWALEEAKTADSQSTDFSDARAEARYRQQLDTIDGDIEYTATKISVCDQMALDDHRDEGE